MTKRSFISCINQVNASTTEDDVAVLVDFVKLNPSCGKWLVKLLPEQHPLFDKKSTNSVNRIRGYILASFEQVGLPDSALPYVLDELQNGLHAYVVAAAAKALRGTKEKMSAYCEFLLQAMKNIRRHDDAVSFESFHPKWQAGTYSTALIEIITTFERLGPHAKQSLPTLRDYLRDEFSDLNKAVKSRLSDAINIIENAEAPEDDCCSDSPENLMLSSYKLGKKTKRRLNDVLLEDQDGNKIKFNDFFIGKKSILSFFYTRCDNPNKCSLTVLKMGQLQAEMINAGLNSEINIGVITYDAEFDTPSRIKNYGRSRGFMFSQNHRMFRIAEGFEALRNHLDLGVNYTSSIVNHHRTELFLLNKNGKIEQGFPRMQWNAKMVIEAVRQLPDRRILFANRWMPRVRVAMSSTANVLVPLLIAFFPKCPFCWAAYLSMFGFAGLQSIPYTPWLLPVFIALGAVNLFALYRRGRRIKNLMPFSLGAIGFVLVLIGLRFSITTLSYTGLALIVAGSLLNMVPARLRWFVSFPKS